MRYFLTGFMGCGKTTYGMSLAARLGMPFVDLDALIKFREGASVSEIFAEVGESGFRYIEQAHLRTMLKYRNVVVSTGGGAPTFLDNMDWMNFFGVTVYLKTPAEILYQRLVRMRSERPLLARLEPEELLPFVREMLQKREEFYDKAHIIVEQTGQDRYFLDALERAVRKFRKRRPAVPAS